MLTVPVFWGSRGWPQRPARHFAGSCGAGLLTAALLAAPLKALRPPLSGQSGLVCLLLEACDVGADASAICTRAAPSPVRRFSFRLVGWIHPIQCPCHGIYWHVKASQAEGLLRQHILHEWIDDSMHITIWWQLHGSYGVRWRIGQGLPLQAGQGWLIRFVLA